MEGSFGSKPMTCFEVEKILDISADGTYRVQWAPAWVSKFHLVGCEHLVQEFLQQQVEEANESDQNTQTVSLKPTEPSFDILYNNSHNEQAEFEINLTVSQETTEASHFNDKERNDCVDKLSYSQQYSEPPKCYDVKPDIYTDVDQGATKQSLNSGKDLTHQFESPDESILDTVVVKLEPNEGIENEMSASNEFNTSFELVGTHDFVSAINPFILKERTNLQSIDYASPLHAEMCEPNLQSFSEEMYPRVRDLGIDRESDTSCKTTARDYCEKSFSCNSMLELNHGIYTGFKPYPCPHCSYSLAQKSTLTTHPSEKAYACNVCQKTFARTELLKLHKCTHDKEKPYTCSTCKKSFSHSTTFKKHSLTHSKGKPHQCDHCGKCFSDKSNLNRHTRTHTGEKPYSCPTCGKRFTRSSNCYQHSRQCTSSSTRKENS